MTQPETNPMAQASSELRINGLDYYARLDHYGNLIQTIGETTTDLAAAASLVFLEGQRLGDMLGISALVSVEAFDESKCITIQEIETDVELLISRKGANPRQILQNLHSLS